MTEVKKLVHVARCQIVSMWCIVAMIAALSLYALADIPHLFYALVPLQMLVTLGAAVLLKRWILLALLIPAVFPYWNMLALLLVSRSATKAIRAEGFSIGIFGAKLSEYVEAEDIHE